MSMHRFSSSVLRRTFRVNVWRLSPCHQRRLSVPAQRIAKGGTLITARNIGAPVPLNAPRKIVSLWGAPGGARKVVPQCPRLFSNRRALWQSTVVAYPYRSFCGGVSFGALSATLLRSNPTVDPVRFALWTLRKKRAQGRSPSR